MTGWPRERLRAWFREHGLGPVHADAWFRTVHREGILDARAVTSRRGTLSPRLQEVLQEVPAGQDLRLERREVARDGTVKLRLGTPRGGAVESVLIPGEGRVTICLSSQVGCGVGCPFCATGTMGLRRNLEAWEMTAQVRLARAHAPGPITNAVFMGMGEPLHNEEAVAGACQVLGDDLGAGLPRSRIVVSTVGVVHRLAPFLARGVAVLAVSLHAATEELRRELVPLGPAGGSLAELRQALQALPLGLRESVTLAYLLLDGCNDGEEHARQLIEWCSGLRVKINLLPLNPYPGCRYRPGPPDRMEAFAAMLRGAGLVTTLRHSRGADIQAACGQLATGKALT